MNTVPASVFDHAVSVFRELHQYPEVGFDLYNTVKVVARELDALGIAYTDQYGQCSLVAQIGNRNDVPTIGIRADMDALPVQEKTNLPYASKIDGVMHACGHDSHTAILLATAEILKGQEDKLPCNVRLFFQPSEEGAVSGAKMMVDNGCMDGVDFALMTHCEQTLHAGTLGICAGDYMAACIPVTIRFYGITSHATLPEAGVDAVAMAVESYGKLKEMVKQEAGDRPYIWSVGHFSGGEVHNVIPDLCTQYISFRFYDLEFAKRVMANAQKICDDIAARYGGRAEVQWHMSTGPVHNDEALTEKFEKIMAAVDTVRIEKLAPKKSSEDFSWYLTKAPGLFFRYGSRNEAKGCVAAPHRPDFCLDEDGMKAAILGFVNFIMNFNR